MARYVLLAFDDNSEAEAFVEAATDGQLYYTKPHPKLPNEVSVNLVRGEVSVRGLWGKPSKFCTCAITEVRDNLVIGSKWGWLIHTGCRLPVQNKWHYLRNQLGLGPTHKGLSGTLLGVIEPQPTDLNVPVGVRSQPPEPQEDPTEDYSKLNLERQGKIREGWGQCHNLHCNRWYKAGTGYYYPGTTRRYAVCSRPCAWVLNNQGR